VSETAILIFLASCRRSSIVAGFSIASSPASRLRTPRAARKTHVFDFACNSPRPANQNRENGISHQKPNFAGSAGATLIPAAKEKMPIKNLLRLPLGPKLPSTIGLFYAKGWRCGSALPPNRTAADIEPHSCQNLSPSLPRPDASIPLIPRAIQTLVRALRRRKSNLERKPQCGE